jgi:hypothetical protein
MTDPNRSPGDHRPSKALWVALGLMALIVVGGLTYGLSYRTIYASNPPQTTGSGGEHVRPNHPL